MVDLLHSKQTVNHRIHTWEYANAAARTGATGFVSTDVGRVSKQIDNDTYWILSATTPTWLQIGGLSAYLPLDGSSAMSGDLDMDDNKIVDVNQLEIGNTASALYHLKMYLDGSGNAVLERGASGYMRYMSGANYPQFYMGATAASGYASIDADNGMTLYINVLDSGDVRIGNLLGPEEGATVPLGDATDRWSKSFVEDRIHIITSIKTGSYTAVGGEIVRVSTTGGMVTITLPSASANTGSLITLKKTTTDGNTMRATRSGADTIEGIINDDHTGSRAYVTYVSDGSSEWLRIA